MKSFFVKINILVLILFGLMIVVPQNIVLADTQSDDTELAEIVVTSSDTENTSLAQFAGCTGTDCSACNVVNMANGLIKWLIGILFILFAVIVTIAGFGLVTSGGNRHALDEAKSKFSNAIIGLIIVLAAWLIVDTIMRGLVGTGEHKGQIDTGTAKGWLFWSEVQCYAPVVATSTPWQNKDDKYTPAEMDTFLIDKGNGETGSVTISTPAGNKVVDIKACDTSNLTTINFLGSRVTVHKQFVASLQRIDAKWRARGGNTFYKVTSLGGYNCRNIEGSNRKSNHSYGLAIDINAARNPHCPKQSGCGGKNILVTDMPSDFVQLFRSEGWGWGGNWRSSKDAMHFSKATGEGGNMSGG